MSFPKIIEDFISVKDVATINAWLAQHGDYLFSQSKSDFEYWNQRAIYYSWMPENIQKIMLDAVLRMKDIIVAEDGPVFAEYPQFIKWDVGVALDPPHADNCNPDGSPNASPWRSHGAVMYFNDDFGGGELFYPNYNLEIKPKPGLAGIHRADWDCLHGVRKVTAGCRMTASVFFTKDEAMAKEQGWF